MSRSTFAQSTEHPDAAVAAVPGSPRYFAWLYAAPPLRMALHTLFAIEQEVRSGLRPGLEHQVAHVRLEWWQEECERFDAGTAMHPLTRALATQLQDSPRGDLRGLVDTARWDLAGATFGTQKEIDAYCERWATAVVETAVTCTTNQTADTARAFGCRLGKALRETELLTALANDAQCGRLRLPLDQLERAHIDPASLAKPPWPESLTRLIRQRHKTLRAELASAIAALPASMQPQLSGLLVWATLALHQSRRAERALPHSLPAHHTVGFVDAWSGWRAARHALKSRYRTDEAG